MNEIRTSTLHIDAVVTEAASRLDLSRHQIEAVATGALGLLDRHASPDLMRPIYDAIAGSEARAVDERGRKAKGGGLFGGVMRSAGGLSGAAIADAMGLADRLKDQGIDRDMLKRALPALRAVVREQTGRDLLGEAIRSVPGVGGLLGAS